MKHTFRLYIKPNSLILKIWLPFVKQFSVSLLFFMYISSCIYIHISLINYEFKVDSRSPNSETSNLRFLVFLFQLFMFLYSILFVFIFNYISIAKLCSMSTNINTDKRKYQIWTYIIEVWIILILTIYTSEVLRL